MVEIARAISYDADLIIMDEPTSALTEEEVETLFGIIRTLRERGVSVIMITHMGEILGLTWPALWQVLSKLATNRAC